MQMLAADEYSFDLSEFEKKPYEFGGLAEFETDYQSLNQDAALYGLNFPDSGTENIQRHAGALELTGKYNWQSASFRFRARSQWIDDTFGEASDTRAQEVFVSLKPETGLTLELGKKVNRWGKGYAWNPVGFVERPKDPGDPDLSREGFSQLSADWIRSFQGDLKTVAFTPVLLPTGGDLNSDFGEQGHLNPAAKLYFLYKDTDIDFMVQGEGSRSARYGVDFARNISSNFEIHGEFARTTDFRKRLLGPTSLILSEPQDVSSYLLGTRYLTENNITVIAEYYHNGTGYTESETRNFFNRLQTDSDTSLVQSIVGSFSRPAPMQDYFYLKTSWKEPLDILYFTPSIRAIINLDDSSSTITPELLYTGIENLELRFRTSWLTGDDLTEFGEKQSQYKIAFRVRYFF